MATVNLGRIKFVWQGAYNGATAYVADDVVSYNGSSYICILASTGNLPTNATYWSLMAQSGTDITSLAGLAQGDVLYYNGTSWVRLGAGTSGQFLQTNGASANPAWANVVSGIIQVKSTILTSVVSFGSGTGMVTGLQCSITPISASNKILVFLQCVVGNSGTTTSSMAIRRNTGSTATTGGTRVGGGDAANSRPSAVAWSGTPYQDWNGTNIGFHFLDAPNTTSQITYGAEITGQDNSGLYIGRTSRDTDDANHGRYSSNLTLIEISSGVL